MKHIAITKADINGAEINSVNSRDLHKNLGVKTEYKKWADRLIEKYGFMENDDYIAIVKNDDGKKSTDYIFCIDMAKEVCMVSNTDKGRETRKYFIKVEKQANQQSNLQLDIQMQRLDALTNVAHATKDKIDNHDSRIENLEKNQKIEHWQQKALIDAKNKIVYSLGGEDKDLIRKLHSRVWSKFKKRFNIPRYNELPAYKYEDGLMYIDSLTMSDMVA